TITLPCQSILIVLTILPPSKSQRHITNKVYFPYARNKPVSASVPILPAALPADDVHPWDIPKCTAYRKYILSHPAAVHRQKLQPPDTSGHTVRTEIGRAS